MTPIYLNIVWHLMTKDKILCYMSDNGSYFSSFVWPGLDFLGTTRRMFLEKQRTLTISMHLVHAPSFRGVRVAHLLMLLCMYYFIYYMFFVVFVCFLHVRLVVVHWLHYFDVHKNLGSLDYYFCRLAKSYIQGTSLTGKFFRMGDN